MYLTVQIVKNDSINNVAKFETDSAFFFEYLKDTVFFLAN